MSVIGRKCDKCGKEKTKDQFEPLMLQEITDQPNGHKLRKVVTIQLGAYEFSEKKVPNFTVTGELLEPNTVQDIVSKPENFDFCTDCTREVAKEILG
jgi:hypothetical protein